MPVVSISSPPESQGVGSASSEMWIQRSGASAERAPAARSSPTSSSRLCTVSIASRLVDALPGVGKYPPQYVVDLFELLGVGDQRRRQLDHRVTAVVGTADQPPFVELTGEEAAQQLLGLL